jgi:ectoine hydroxylase-related dioxygenase (phytanoyl-CoA dioxygenase family)
MQEAVMAAVTQANRDQYRRDGYFVLERALSGGQLADLRRECSRAVARIEARMDAEGVDTLDISHRGRRYFAGNLHRDSEAVRHVVFSELFADICRATIGEEAYLFFEQFVVKGPEQGLKFGWHQDSGYLPLEHRPYVTCWCALDDVTERNGAVSVLPFARAGAREKIEHWKEPGTNDMIGYDGADPGVLVPVPAGSVVVFSSVTLHRSGPNLTDTPRRAWIAQYSPDPILYEDGSPRQNAVPFLHEGRVLEPA